MTTGEGKVRPAAQRRTADGKVPAAAQSLATDDQKEMTETAEIRETTDKAAK
jgi:hypothetical protein